ncbi:MAG: glycosyltransferase [Bacteroidales bacterium]|nr:glycosyltransferase [Bacteroidales bacterium]
MVVLFNASTVKIGGGLSVALNFLYAFRKPENWSKVILVAPAGCGYESVINNQILFYPLTSFQLKKIFRIFIEKYRIPKIISKHNADLVFNLGNLPLPLHIKQAILFDNPFVTASSLKNLNLSLNNLIQHKIRNFIFSNRLRFTELIFSQTRLQKELLERKFSNIPKIVIIPNTYSILKKETLSSRQFNIDRSKTNLLAFSWYYPHKNLEILYDVALLFKAKNLSYKIYLTIDNSQGKKARKLIQKINHPEIKPYIENLGKIDSFNLEQFYTRFNGVILPSILESNSSVYAEAIKFNVPLFVSNFNFAREICIDHANYFNPYSANSIYKSLVNKFENPENVYNKNPTAGHERKKFPSWYELAEKIVGELNTLGGNNES